MVATGGPPPEAVTIVLPQLQFLHQLLLQRLLQFLPQLLLQLLLLLLLPPQLLLQPPILKVSSSYGHAIRPFLFIVTIYR